jgi:hypothetical protein
MQDGRKNEISIGSVLEYGSVCYAGMAKTHMLLLERIQYRALRISMGLMGLHRYDPNCFILISNILPIIFRTMDTHYAISWKN